MPESMPRPSKVHPVPPPPDPRALKILLRYYGSSRGGPSLKDKPLTPDDFAYANSMGFPFGSVFLTHDQIMQRLLAVLARTTRRAVTNAFLFSLSSRRLDYRSAFGSFTVFQFFAEHPAPPARISCEYCGSYLEMPFAQSLSTLNYERHKWGGVRHNQPIYAILDLELFQALPPVTPTAQDIDIFKNMLAVIRAVPPKTTSTALQKHLTGILEGSKGERDNIVAMLGFCGVLANPKYPSYSKAFVPASAREHYTEMDYPASYWRGMHGIDESELKRWFGYVL